MIIIIINNDAFYISILEFGVAVLFARRNAIIFCAQVTSLFISDCKQIIKNVITLFNCSWRSA